MRAFDLYKGSDTGLDSLYGVRSWKANCLFINPLKQNASNYKGHQKLAIVCNADMEFEYQNEGLLTL